MKTLLSAAVAALLCAGAAVPASAALIHWTVQGAVFDDGTGLTGGFDVDSSTHAASNFSLSVQGGAVLSAFTYDSATDRYFDFGATRYIFVDGLSGTITRYLSLQFSQALTTAGTVALTNGSSYECNNCSSLRYLLSGSVTSEAVVPEPAMLGLFGLGAIGLGLSRRRKAA